MVERLQRNFLTRSRHSFRTVPFQIRAKQHEPTGIRQVGHACVPLQPLWRASVALVSAHRHYLVGRRVFMGKCDGMSVMRGMYAVTSVEHTRNASKRRCHALPHSTRRHRPFGGVTRMFDTDHRVHSCHYTPSVTLARAYAPAECSCTPSAYETRATRQSELKAGTPT